MDRSKSTFLSLMECMGDLEEREEEMLPGKQ